MTTPSNYVCKDCGASHCKLWRVGGSSNIRLYCISCAESVSGDRLKLGRNSSDQLYNGGLNLVPAVPTEDGEEWYGYTSVPQDRCDWWGALPMSTPPKAKMPILPSLKKMQRKMQDAQTEAAKAACEPTDRPGERCRHRPAEMRHGVPRCPDCGLMAHKVWRYLDVEVAERIHDDIEVHRGIGNRRWRVQRVLAALTAHTEEAVRVERERWEVVSEYVDATIASHGPLASADDRDREALLFAKLRAIRKPTESK